MSLYSEAVEVIRTYSEAKQAELDAVAAKAKNDYIAKVREMCTEGIAKDDPRYSICALVANTLKFEDSDGSLRVSLPNEIASVVAAARNAGIFTGYYTEIGNLCFHACLSGLGSVPDCLKMAREAACEAKNYRSKQSYKGL